MTTEKNCVKFSCSICILSFTVCKAWLTVCHLIRGKEGIDYSEEWDASISLQILVWNSTLKASKKKEKRKKAGLLINIIPLQTCSPHPYFSEDKCLTNIEWRVFFLLIRDLWWASLKRCVLLTLLVSTLHFSSPISSTAYRLLIF